jgi:hypothetical protein
MQVCRSALYKTKESYIYIYMCVYVRVHIYFVLLFTCEFEPLTHALFEQVQRDRRVVFDPAQDTPSPKS